MSEAIIAAIAAGVGSIIAAVSTLIVNTIKAKKEKTGDLELQYQHQERLIELTSGLRNDLSQEFENIRDRFDCLETKVDKFSIEQKRINLGLLRHDITTAYNSFKDQKKMPLTAYESVMNLYDIYEKYGGNGYCKQIINEMKEWDKE